MLVLRSLMSRFHRTVSRIYGVFEAQASQRKRGTLPRCQGRRSLNEGLSSRLVRAFRVCRNLTPLTYIGRIKTD